MTQQQQGQSGQGRPQQTNRQQDLAGLLGGLLGGQPVQNAPQAGGGGQGMPGAGQSNDVANILGGLLGGSSAAGNQPQSGSMGQGQPAGQQSNQGGSQQQSSSPQTGGAVTWQACWAACSEAGKRAMPAAPCLLSKGKARLSKHRRVATSWACWVGYWAAVKAGATWRAMCWAACWAA